MFLLDLFECINVASAPCVVWKKSTYSLESLTGNPSVWLKQKSVTYCHSTEKGELLLWLSMGEPPVVVSNWQSI